MKGQRPNILWILTDEHRTDSMGCYGSAWGRSPNIDGIAAQGVRFEHCTVQSPVCIASRTSQITGLYPHTTGVLTNHFPPSRNAEPLTWVFRDAGCQVANVGKIHYGDRSRSPFEIRYPSPGHGGAASTPFALKEGYDPEDYDVVFAPCKWATRTAREMSWPDRLIVGGRYPLPKEEAEPGEMALKAAEFLANEAKPPFFLRVSIIAPHTPVLASDPFYGSTAPDQIRLPLPTQEELAAMPKDESRRLRAEVGFSQLSPAQIAQARANYYDLCAQVDDAVGVVLDALHENGYADNTIIAFNSDHGVLLGEHGLGQKTTFYDPIVRVAWIVSYPERLPTRRVVTDPVELADFMPTLLSLAGLDIPKHVHGTDLVPQMLGEVSIPNRPVFSEIDQSQQALGEWDDGRLAELRGRTHRAMVRLGKWKMWYSLRDGGYGEDGALFDLESDPFEIRNLYNCPDFVDVVAELKSLLAQWQSR